MTTAPDENIDDMPVGSRDGDLYEDCCPHCGFCGDEHSALCTDCLPRYEHDCPNDVFLGRFEQYDVYIATAEHHGAGVTYIARTSDEPADYLSGVELVGRHPAITEAHRLATLRGIALPHIPQEDR